MTTTPSERTGTPLVNDLDLVVTFGKFPVCLGSFNVRSAIFAAESRLRRDVCRFVPSVLLRSSSAWQTVIRTSGTFIIPFRLISYKNAAIIPATHFMVSVAVSIPSPSNYRTPSPAHERNQCKQFHLPGVPERANSSIPIPQPLFLPGSRLPYPLTRISHGAEPCGKLGGPAVVPVLRTTNVCRVTYYLGPVAAFKVSIPNFNAVYNILDDE
jgi:hypothetical protein